jgi:hypothetical protein
MSPVLRASAFRLPLIPPSSVQLVFSVLALFLFAALLAFFTFLAAIAHGSLLLPVLLNPV